MERRKKPRFQGVTGKDTFADEHDSLGLMYCASSSISPNSALHQALGSKSRATQGRIHISIVDQSIQD